MTIIRRARRVPVPAGRFHMFHTGQSLVEWTLLLALVSITCAATLGQLGVGVSSAVVSVTDALVINNGEGGNHIKVLEPPMGTVKQTN